MKQADRNRTIAASIAVTGVALRCGEKNAFGLRSALSHLGRAVGFPKLYELGPILGQLVRVTPDEQVARWEELTTAAEMGGHEMEFMYARSVRGGAKQLPWNWDDLTGKPFTTLVVTNGKRTLTINLVYESQPKAYFWVLRFEDGRVKDSGLKATPELLTWLLSKTYLMNFQGDTRLALFKEAGSDTPIATKLLY